MEHERVQTPAVSESGDGPLPDDAELVTALDAAYRALRDACHQARAVLMDAQPGRLPSSWECDPSDRWLLDAIEAAEQQVDRLRLRRQPLARASAAAARRAAAAALPATVGRAARREREATRVIGPWAEHPGRRSAG